MKHLIILLNKWDWIQLSNINKKIVKHGDSNVEVTTLKSLPAALKNVDKDYKIHIVGHGGPGTLSGTTPNQLADLIHKDLKNDIPIKIRVDTCSSAVQDKSNNTTAGMIKNRLINKHRRSPKDIETSGTTGPSVTGAAGKRIVVQPALVDDASLIQETLKWAHRIKIQQANIKVSGINESSNSTTIKNAAKAVGSLTKDFFDDFAHLLTDRKLAIDHMAKAHKETY